MSNLLSIHWGRYRGSRNRSHSSKAGGIAGACRHYLTKVALLCPANTKSDNSHISMDFLTTPHLPKTWTPTLQKSGVVKMVVKGPAPLDSVDDSVCVLVIAMWRGPWTPRYSIESRGFRTKRHSWYKGNSVCGRSETPSRTVEHHASHASSGRTLVPVNPCSDRLQVQGGSQPRIC